MWTATNDGSLVAFVVSDNRQGESYLLFRLFQFHGRYMTFWNYASYEADIRISLFMSDNSVFDASTSDTGT